MQQTKFDHWLRKKFVHETLIYCNTLPRGLDERFPIEEAAADQPASHRFRIRPWNDEALLELVERLRLEGITYAATIQDKSGPLARWLGQPGRSLTCEAIWFVLAVTGAGCLLAFLPLGKIVALAKEAFSF
jgi:hypothetical protein